METYRDNQYILIARALQRDLESVERLKRDLEKTYAFVQKRFGIDNRIQ